MSDQCTLINIRAAANACQFVIESCHNQQVIPFTRIFFCDVNENWIILVVFGLIFVLLVFHFISEIADNYLAPCLLHISKYLNMSQTLTGVTILPLANGAGDVMTAVVASGSDEGIKIVIGSIFGASLFLTTVVLAAVIYYSKTIKIDRRQINRDIIFNLIGTLIIIIYALIGYINRMMALSFPLIYVIYIIVVLINERQTKNENVEIQRKLDEKLTRDALQQEEQKQQKEIVNTNNQDGQILQQEDDLNQDEDQPFIKSSPERATVEVRASKAKQKKIIEQQEFDSKVLEEPEKTWQEMSLSERAFFLYAYPLELLRKVTIPACNEEQWDKNFALLNCFFAPPAFLILNGIINSDLFGTKTIFILWALTLIIAVCIYYTCDSNPPKGIFFIVLMGGVQSVVWAKVCVEVMVDFLVLVQVITGISYGYLGMTFLAYGNSAADFLVDCKVAKLGFGLMAATGCYSSALFNLFVGFGFAIVRKTWFDGVATIQFSLFQELTSLNPQSQEEYDLYMEYRMNNAISYTLLLFSVIIFCSTLVIVRIKNYRFNSNLAFFFWIFYGIFFVLITFIAITHNAIISYLRPEK